MHLNEEEQRVIEFIFASSYRKELRKLIQEHLQKRPAEEQQQFFQKSVIKTLNKFPDCEGLLEPLNNFFSFMKKDGGNLQREAFPYSLKQFSKEKILNWLVYYYRTTFLDEAGARQVLWRYAVSNNLTPESLPEEKQNECFLSSLTNNSQLSQL